MNADHHGNVGDGHRALPLEPDKHGYCYESRSHYDSVMTRAAGRLVISRDPRPRRLAWIAALTAIFIGFVGVGMVESLDITVRFAIGTMLLIAFGILGVWGAGRELRLIKSIIRERACLACGYPLRHLGTDGQGYGTCPECGRRYNVGEYRRPPNGYLRSRD